MSNKKQSSVKWLVKIYLQTKKIDSFDIEQAKAMHKKEITDSYDDGYSDSDNGNIINKQYYTETFNSDEA